LGTFLRWNTSLPPQVSELVILATARHYSCHYIWYNHVRLAIEHGVDPHAVEALKHRADPSPLLAANARVAYALAREILQDASARDDTVAEARAAFGDRGVVEIASLIAHYHAGAILLSLGDVPLPDGSRTCLP